MTACRDSTPKTRQAVIMYDQSNKYLDLNKSFFFITQAVAQYM